LGEDDETAGEAGDETVGFGEPGEAGIGEAGELSGLALPCLADFDSFFFFFFFSITSGCGGLVLISSVSVFEVELPMERKKGGEGGRRKR